VFQPAQSAGDATMRRVASIEELAADTRAILAQVAAACRAVMGVAAPIEEAGRMYAQLGMGSTEPDLADSAACLRAAYAQCREALALLDQGVDRLNAYLTVIVGTPADHAPQLAAASPARSTGEPWKLTGSQVEKLRRALPPPITANERGTGRKTHGRWVGTDGMERPIMSGQDELAEIANKALQRLGLRTLSVADHAEMKVAALLRQQFEATGTPQHATIVQNNEPCYGRLGCPAVLPFMLPAGCTLTVRAPNYRRTFTGGATR
jgi:hypothetical protein